MTTTARGFSPAELSLADPWSLLVQEVRNKLARNAAKINLYNINTSLRLGCSQYNASPLQTSRFSSGGPGPPDTGSRHARKRFRFRRQAHRISCVPRNLHGYLRGGPERGLTDARCG